MLLHSETLGPTGIFLINTQNIKMVSVKEVNTNVLIGADLKKWVKERNEALERERKTL